MNSYDKINYKLRPQKRIERALMAELINKLRYKVNKPINYVGMGSLFYTDFVFFYRNCDIDKMISIECMMDSDGNYDNSKETRFLFNRPMERIKLLPKLVEEAIQDKDIPFDENNFIWYDYDGMFVPEMIGDLAETLRKLNNTTVLAVSYNTSFPMKYKCQNQELDLKTCLKEYKKYILGQSLGESAFTKKKYAHTVNVICDNYLQNVISERNKEEVKNYKFVPISKISYKDGAEMCTKIWLFFDPKYYPDLEKEFAKLKIFGDTNLIMENLTLIEKMYLDKHCGESNEDLAKQLGLELTTVQRYYEYSKYIPEYSEVMI